MGIVLIDAGYGNNNNSTFEKADEIDYLITVALYLVCCKVFLAKYEGDRLEIEGKNLIAGAKQIDLGIQLGKQAVFLVITIIPEAEDKLGVQVQLYPLAEHTYLPPRMELALLSETEETLANVASRLYDNFIQLPYFKGKVGESFRIKVTLDNVSLVEKFTF